MTSPTPEGQRVASILDVRVSCRACDWHGTVGEAKPDVDGEGSLGCSVCGSVLGFSPTADRPALGNGVWYWYEPTTSGREGELG